MRVGQSPSRLIFVRAALLLAGVLWALASLGLLFAPEWFFQNIGNFPPFNRHYMGDAGAFLLPIGVGLLFAARNTVQHKALIGLGAGAGVLHALNHIYDSVIEQAPLAHWLGDTLPQVVLAVLLVAAYFSLPAGRRPW